MLKTKTYIVSTTKCWKAILPFVLAFNTFNCIAQEPGLNSLSYIDCYREEAVNQMIAYKIPASVILAQAIFESNCGKSVLAKKSNNHFGIKCHNGWYGDTIVKNDDTLNECFRKYNNVEESYKDHSLFLRSRPRYSFLFNLSVLDYKNWCIGLKACGYATYPSYAQALIIIIEDYKLYEIDGAEKMTMITNLSLNNVDLKLSYFSLSYITLNDFVQSDALFTEERDALIQSLNLIVEDDVTEIAENYKYCKPRVLNGTHDM